MYRKQEEFYYQSAHEISFACVGGVCQIASLWMPIATFVALGLEHSVANMFLIPLGMSLGADVTVWDLIANLVSVTLGNAVGAALFIGGIQRISVFGSSGAMRPPAP